MIDVKVPSPGESITEVQIATWLVADGDFVEKDQEIVEIDSDKATLSISAEEDGQIKILVEEGETVEVNSVIASIDTSIKGEPKAKSQELEAEAQESKVEKKPVTSSQQPVSSVAKPAESKPAPQAVEAELNISPLAKKLMQENNVSETEFINFMKGFRVGKKDVEFFMAEKGNTPT